MPNESEIKFGGLASFIGFVLVALVIGFGLKAIIVKFSPKSHSAEPWRNDAIVLSPCPEGTPKWQCDPIVKPANSN